LSDYQYAPLSQIQFLQCVTHGFPYTLEKRGIRTFGVQFVVERLHIDHIVDGVLERMPRTQRSRVMTVALMRVWAVALMGAMPPMACRRSQVALIWAVPPMACRQSQMALMWAMPPMACRQSQMALMWAVPPCGTTIVSEELQTARSLLQLRDYLITK
jgi:hypothetical protein